MRSVALDTGVGLYSFNGEAMLVCPRCAGLAWSRTLEPGARDMFAPRRVTCTHCAYTKLWQTRSINRVRGEYAADDYFHLPLYLQVACPDGPLWAYNLAHLAYLRDWLQARLRTRRVHPEYGWSNGSYLSCLPRWIKSAGNRATIAAALGKLETLAAQGKPARVQHRRAGAVRGRSGAGAN